MASCYKNHLYVQQEWIDENFLASTHVGTPDPRKANPPQGQRLLVGWDFPRSLYEEGLTLLVTVRFWNNVQDVLFQPVDRRRSYAAFYFSNKDSTEDRRILTYRIQVLNARGAIIETWKHHFWTELIEIASSANRISSSVSSHPKQGSVIDTP